MTVGRLAAVAVALCSVASARQQVSFDLGWRHHLGADTGGQCIDDTYPIKVPRLVVTIRRPTRLWLR
jgi:hypothetical protein